MLFGSKSRNEDISDVTKENIDNTKTNTTPVRSDEAGVNENNLEDRSDEEENFKEQRDDEELYEIAMSIYEDYTDNALGGMRRGYADKDSNSLSFSKQRTLNDLRKKMVDDEREFTIEEIDKMLDRIDSKIYRYDILDDLIADENISDIKCYSHDNIRIKRRGHRFPSNISFKDDREYRDFVTRVLERNNINFGTANANQTFTDDTQDGAILRVSCISELLIDGKKPCIALRKIQKEKRTLSELSGRGMFDKILHVKEHADERFCDNNAISTNEELQSLIPKIVDSRGVIFTGKGASGKTTLMNALLELIPYDESIMICQENSELFIEGHPDCLCTHVLTNNGDAKISYGLSALTRMGLLIDLDRIIVGEIKQPDEAEGLSKASITGHKCWTSVHGENCDMAMKKMADYISQANPNYTFADSLNQLQGFEYVVHLSSFQVDEIVQITGWDYDKNELITQCVYKI